VSENQPTTPTDNGQPARAAASVIRRLDGAEETPHDRLMKKHVPAWVISGAVHVAFIALMILIFGRGGNDARATDKILTTSVEKPEDQPDKDLTNEDLGLQSDLMAAIQNEREDKANVDALATQDSLGVPNTDKQDDTALPLPGLNPTDSPNAGVAGDLGMFKGGDGGNRGFADTGFVGRSGATKSKLLQSGGGNDESERAVALGLAWLAKQQQPDGKWVYDGTDKADTAAATGMSLLPFLAAGNTHKTGKYQKTVLAGVNYLIKNMSLSGNNAGHFTTARNMYAQAIATIAVCECYGMTRDKQLLLAPCQAAINYIQRAQGPNGSWGYQAGNTGDTSIVGWQIQALKAAQLGKDIVVDDKVIKRAMQFLDTVGAGSYKAAYGYTNAAGAAPGTSLTAVGLLSRYYAAGWGPNNPAMIEGVIGLMRRAPVKQQITTVPDMYYYYYATQVVHFYEGEEWKTWNEGPLVNGKRGGGMRDSLVSLQVRNNGANHGSWDPDAGFIGRSCGRLGSTCMVLLTLEVYYRHLPLYKRDNAGGQRVLDAGAK
jgi:hypothetical protein